MKRTIATVTVFILFFLFFSSPAAADTEEAAGYDYSLSFRLHPEAFSVSSRKRAEAYAELFNSFDFRGSYSHSLSSTAFDLHLNIIPKDPSSEALYFRFYGRPANILIQSPLLSTQTVSIFSKSLLEFAVKTYAHLNLSLRFPVLLFPYVYEYAFDYPLQAWRKTFDSTAEQSAVEPAAIQKLALYLQNQLDENNGLKNMIQVLGLGTDFSDAISTEFELFPSYLSGLVSSGDPLIIRRNDHDVTWSNGDRILYRASETDTTVDEELFLPETQTGYIPLYHRSDTTDGFSRFSDMEAGYVKKENEDESLFHLFASLSSLPLSWPADCSAEGNLKLSGLVFPNGEYSLKFNGADDGQFSLCLYDRSMDQEREMMTVSGRVLPQAEAVVPSYSDEEYSRSLNLMSINDTSLSALISTIYRPALKGMLRFLVGIPSSACRQLMDDLTDSGILNFLLAD